MVRNRVLSFMSQFSKSDSQRSSPDPTSPPHVSSSNDLSRHDAFKSLPNSPPPESRSPSQQAYAQRDRVQGERVSSRPMSMVQTYQPSLMELNQDTLPELQPIFTFLNSHANKLYQEGYFLKLDDQNSNGKPNVDRTWTECFAQLVGTILSLWDAAELDAAGQDGEVLPKFINLTDASIKMIEALPTRSNDDQPLQNVLSISTAGKNRYLLHFNSHHSLIQWTAGIRLAMYEHATLQEAYTGALIAGKGKGLNNINLIMERSRFQVEDWVRVRFGAGTPWRRCWCVITPPDEKEYQKLQKEMNKKKSAYDRSRPPVLKGDVKFYDTKIPTKKSKKGKAQPIASITDAYSAFAIYPQSKPLIEASTLVKVEGTINIHSNPPTSTEGFVFVMPEVHAAVSGFEMMLRWLFPVFDTFALYGRPGRLVADTLDPRSLMFAMPRERRYGYLDILDVTNLILTDGSQTWREAEWRRKMKDLTSKRMTAIANGSRRGSRYSSRRNTMRNSFGPSRSRPDIADGASIRSTPSVTWGQAPAPEIGFGGTTRTDSAPPAGGNTYLAPQPPQAVQHGRSVSEAHGLDRYQNQSPSPFDGGYDAAPAPPPHGGALSAHREGSGLRYEQDISRTPERASSEEENAARSAPVPELENLQRSNRVEPVATPPAFSHAPGTLPVSKPYHSPELRRANSRMSQSTLSQMTGAAAGAAVGAGVYGHRDEQPRVSADSRRQNLAGTAEDQGVLSDVNQTGMHANHNLSNEGMVAGNSERLSFERALPPAPPLFNVTPASYSTTRNPQYQSPNSSSQHMPPPQYETPQPAGPAFSQNYTSPLPDDSPASMGRPQGHVPTSSTDSTHQQLSPLNTNRQSIMRKPLPGQSPIPQTPEVVEPQTASTFGSLDDHIDQEGFNKVIPRSQIQETSLNTNPVNRQNSSTSTYQEPTSAVEPDYSRPTQPRQSGERPRSGVLKVVGSQESSTGQESGQLLNIDFGRTLNYATSHPVDPSPNQRTNMVQNTDPDRYDRPSSRSRNVATPDPDRYRHESDNNSGSRSVPWQPAMTISANNSPGRRVLTPEEFVQQRAANATPQYAHQRQASGNTSRSDSPTFPQGRRRSQDLLSHSRNNSSELLPRPSSRGASAALGPSGAGDYSSHLSAREQEQVARATGSPLINLPGGRASPSPSGGLVGAIEAREREKREMKHGLNSQAVQQAISQRQMAQAQAQYQNMQQYPDPYGRQYVQGGAYPRQSPGSQYPPQYRQPQHQSPMPSPPAGMQGGQWGPRQNPTPERQQQQYFPPQYQQDQGHGQYNNYRG